MKNFQIVVLSPEQDIDQEIGLLHQLFEHGLAYYHLRKPHKNYQEHCDFLQRIDSQYHGHIVPHFYHELLQAYKLKGIHFQEQKRKEVFGDGNTVEKYLASLQPITKNITLSTSFHAPEVLDSCPIAFDYHFLSPVFSSISKQGYEGKGFDVGYIQKTIVGMGGVTSKNIHDFIRLGYQGVGVLGGIWNNPSPVEEYKAIVEASKEAMN